VNKYIFVLFFLLLIIIITPKVFAQIDHVGSFSEELENSKQLNPDKILMLVYTNSKWAGEIQDGNYVTHEVGKIGNDKFQISCGESNTISVHIYPILANQGISVYLIKNNKILANQEVSTPGQAFDATIDCFAEGKFQPNDTEYGMKDMILTIPIVMIFVLMIFVGKKYLSNK